MIAGIIPARYRSTRFPGKPLIEIEGKTMIRRVYEQASKSRSLDHVVVATDDQRIYDHVIEFGGRAVITNEDHKSGTDRCFEALQKLEKGYDHVINIQGDEPFIDPSQIDILAATLKDSTTEIATLVIGVNDHEILFDTGEVKVVVNNKMEALYFSRMVIPFINGVEQKDWHLHHKYYRHVGMYGYRKDILRQIIKIPVSPLEKAESLEQLRWLQNGFNIKCAVTYFESHCIDTLEDIPKIVKINKHLS